MDAGVVATASLALRPAEYAHAVRRVIEAFQGENTIPIWMLDRLETIVSSYRIDVKGPTTHGIGFVDDAAQARAAGWIDGSAGTYFLYVVPHTDAEGIRPRKLKGDAASPLEMALTTEHIASRLRETQFTHNKRLLLVQSSAFGTPVHQHLPERVTEIAKGILTPRIGRDPQRPGPPTEVRAAYAFADYVLAVAPPGVKLFADGAVETSIATGQYADLLRRVLTEAPILAVFRVRSHGSATLPVFKVAEAIPFITSVSTKDGKLVTEASATREGDLASALREIVNVSARQPGSWPGY